MGANNRDRNTFHSWINWPNNTTKKCTVCGCILKKNGSQSTYELNGIVSHEFIPCKKIEMEMNKCRIRKDLIEKGLGVPVGKNGKIFEDIEYTYQWVGDNFFILVGGRWKTAYSIDFEF